MSKKLLNKSKGFTLVELMVVVLILGIILSMVVPKFFRQAQNSISGSQIISDFQYIAQAIGNYASDYKRYPNQLSDLNAGDYKYLPDVSINANQAVIDGITFSYVLSDNDCGSSPSLSISDISSESYNEVKNYIGTAIKWRLNDANRMVKLCL